MRYQLPDGNVIVAEQDFIDSHYPGAVSLPETAAAAPVERVLTHLQFRRLFTSAEQELMDEVEVTFESNPTFTTAQKRTLRTGYKNFYAASDVNLDDPAIPPVLALYEALGVLALGRAAEVLA